MTSPHLVVKNHQRKRVPKRRAPTQKPQTPKQILQRNKPAKPVVQPQKLKNKLLSQDVRKQPLNQETCHRQVQKTKKKMKTSPRIPITPPNRARSW